MGWGSHTTAGFHALTSAGASASRVRAASSAAVDRTAAGDVHMWMNLAPTSGVPTNERGEIGAGWLMYSNLQRSARETCQRSAQLFVAVRARTGREGRWDGTCVRLWPR